MYFIFLLFIVLYSANHLLQETYMPHSQVECNRDVIDTQQSNIVIYLRNIIIMEEIIWCDLRLTF